MKGAEDPDVMPTQPMSDLEPGFWDFYADRFMPGTMAYCECDAGPRHLVGIVPGTESVRVHVHIDVDQKVITMLRIHDGPFVG